MQLAESMSTIYSLEEEILVSTVKDGVVMTSADAKENFNVRQTLKLEYPIPFLMDIRNLPDMTIEAIRSTANQPDSDNYSAAALVVKEAIHQLVARESKRFKGHDIPYRTFDSREKAIAWLQTYL